MATTASSSRSGSRAIQIPRHDVQADTYQPPTQRRRRVGRHNKASESIDSSDHGPSSLNSDPASSWSGSPASYADDRMHITNTLNGHDSKDARVPISMLSQGSNDSLSTWKRKDKAAVRSSTPPAPPIALPAGPMLSTSPSPLGPSMRLSTSYKSVNLNEHRSYDDEPPRLITYTKHGQGFTWNDELFLPSYLVGRYSGRGRRKHYDGDFGDEESCPVTEIFVTDEEAARMMP